MLDCFFKNFKDMYGNLQAGQPGRKKNFALIFSKGMLHNTLRVYAEIFFRFHIT